MPKRRSRSIGGGYLESKSFDLEDPRASYDFVITSQEGDDLLSDAFTAVKGLTKPQLLDRAILRLTQVNAGYECANIYSIAELVSKLIPATSPSSVLHRIAKLKREGYLEEISPSVGFEAGDELVLSPRPYSLVPDRLTIAGSEAIDEDWGVEDPDESCKAALTDSISLIIDEAREAR